MIKTNSPVPASLLVSDALLRLIIKQESKYGGDEKEIKRRLFMGLLLDGQMVPYLKSMGIGVTKIGEKPCESGLLIHPLNTDLDDHERLFEFFGVGVLR